MEYRRLGPPRDFVRPEFVEKYSKIRPTLNEGEWIVITSRGCLLERSMGGLSEIYLQDNHTEGQYLFQVTKGDLEYYQALRNHYSARSIPEGIRSKFNELLISVCKEKNTVAFLIFVNQTANDEFIAPNGMDRVKPDFDLDKEIVGKFNDLLLQLEQETNTLWYMELYYADDKVEYFDHMEGPYIVYACIEEFQHLEGRYLNIDTLNKYNLVINPIRGYLLQNGVGVVGFIRCERKIKL